MLRAIAKLNLLLILPVALVACHLPQGISQAKPKSDSIQPLPNPSIHPPALAPLSQQDIEQIKQKAHSAALKRLAAKAIERNPKSRPVVQSLLSHPRIAFQMFEQCYDYYLDSRPGRISNRERQKLDEDMTIRYSQRFLEDVGAQIYSTSPTQSLITINCLYGPYWAATVNYLYSDMNGAPTAKLLSLTLFEEESGKVVQKRSTIVRGVSRFDEKTREFSFTHKFRGIGGCGFAGTYRLENDQLVMQEFRAQWECNGKIGPGNYPRIYP
jgi:serine/threonine protein kinase